MGKNKTIEDSHSESEVRDSSRDWLRTGMPGGIIVAAYFLGGVMTSMKKMMTMLMKSDMQIIIFLRAIILDSWRG